MLGGEIMRMYFKNKNNRLAIDTDSREYFSTVDGYTINDNHRFIDISENDMITILLELDFNMFANTDFLKCE